MYTLTGLGQLLPRGDCSGWEKDPESFSKRVAEHYARTVLNVQLPAKKTVPYYPPGKDIMEVTFSDTLGVAVSFRGMPSYILAFRLRHQPVGPVRWYTYSCTAQGQLVLTRRRAPTTQERTKTESRAGSY